MNAKRAADTVTELAQIMTPNEANVIGQVFGGAVLSLIDLTASATASRFAGHICVTAAFDRVDFHRPVNIGELLTLRGRVTFVGRTSLEVTIDVTATNLVQGESRHTNTARVTMVALADGKPVAVPRLICETREEKVAFLAGKLRRDMRQAFRADVEARVSALDGLSDAELDALIAGD